MPTRTRKFGVVVLTVFYLNLFSGRYPEWSHILIQMYKVGYRTPDKWLLEATGVRNTIYIYIYIHIYIYMKAALGQGEGHMHL